MASMRKTSGRYYARFYDRSRDPKRKTYPLKTKRQDVARRRLSKLEKGYREGAFDPWQGGWLHENQTLKEAIDRFLNVKEREGRRPNTIDSYRWKLKGLREHTPPGIMVRDVLPEHVYSYIHAPMKRGGGTQEVSNSTKRSRHRHLKAFFAWAVEEGLTDKSPIADVKSPRKEKKAKAFLRPEDVDRILQAVEGHREDCTGQPGPTPNDEWLKEIFVVAISTGLRRGELLNLRWIDIDLENDHLLVRNRDNFRAKSGNERTVPLAGDGKDLLQRMHETRDPHPQDSVFLDAKGNVPKPDRVSKRFKKYIRKANLPNSEDLSFHSCRHTTGSWLAMKGVPLRIIAEILGHSSTEVTEMYSHLQPEVMHRAMRETFEADN